MNLCKVKVPKRNKKNIEAVNKRIDTVVGYSELISTFGIDQLRALCITLRNKISFADEMTGRVEDVYEYSIMHDVTESGRVYRKGLDNELMSLGDLRYVANTVLDEVYVQIRAYGTC